MANTNVEALNAGFKFRLEIFTANLQRSGHDYCKTIGEARKRRDTWRKAGYVVSIHEINSVGGLEVARR